MVEKRGFFFFLSFILTCNINKIFVKKKVKIKINLKKLNVNFVLFHIS